jgi:hypothetical protein
MGEWSDFFEDFPEENPANWVDGRFDPSARERLNQLHRIGAEPREKARSEIFGMIEEAKKKQEQAKKEQKDRSILRTQDCPQCGSHELNVYRFSEADYLCECQKCGAYGRAGSENQALKEQRDRSVLKVQECLNVAVMS